MSIRFRPHVMFCQVGLIAATFTGWGRAASAQAPSEDPAVALYQQSAELYRQRHFAEAAVLLREAYRRRPDPVLQYNLARACEEMRDFQCAVDAYQSYLASASPSDRAAIEQRLARCRAQLAATAPSEGVSGTKKSRSLLLPGIVTGAGVVCAGVGLALALTAHAHHRDAARETVQQSAVAKQESAESLMRNAKTTLIAGGIVAAAGAAWWVAEAVLARPASASKTPIAVWLAPDSIGLAVKF